MLQWSLHVPVMMSVVKLNSPIVVPLDASVNRVPLIVPVRNVGETSGVYPEPVASWRLEIVKLTSTSTMFSLLVAVITQVIVRSSEPTSLSSPKVSKSVLI